MNRLRKFIQSAPIAVDSRRHGYVIEVRQLIRGLLYEVDVYWQTDPDHGEGPSSFLSWRTPSEWALGRALRRGKEMADIMAEEVAH
jgi:hypothetical protein